MENQKQGNGKTIIIVILVLAVLGLGGYIAYDKMDENSKSTSLEKEVKQLNNEITILKKEKQASQTNKTEQSGENTVVENNSYVNAVYYGFKEDAASNNYPKEFLALFNDGTYTDVFVDAGGNGAGTYEIKDNTLILHTPKTAMADGGDVTLEFSQDKTQIVKDGITLQKLK